MEQNLTFGEALAELKEGATLSRRGFNKAHKIKVQFPDENSANNQAYLFIVTPEGVRVPWVASQCDLLKDDWYVVE